MENGIGIVVFGVGRMGSIHAENCIGNRRVELLYIVEYDQKKANDFIAQNRLTNVKCVDPSNMHIALDDTRVQAAIVSTVTHTHKDIVMACLAKGKAVLCEKPLAENFEDVAICYEEAKKLGLPLLCAFNRRFDPSHRKVREEIVAGKIGNVRVIKTCSRDHTVPPISYLKISRGMFHDCAVHDVDLILWTLKELPSTVFAQGTAFIPDVKPIGDVDHVIISMKFPSGVLAQIDLARFASFGYDQRLEVLGECGMLQSENQSKSSVVFSNDKGLTSDVLKPSFPSRYIESYKNELDHFLDVFEGKSEIVVNVDDVLLATQVVQACEISHKRGQALKLQWSISDSRTIMHICDN